MLFFFEIKNGVAIATPSQRPDQEPILQMQVNNHAFTWRYAYNPVVFEIWSVSETEFGLTLYFICF
jgi:hypothetical protein